MEKANELLSWKNTQLWVELIYLSSLFVGAIVTLCAIQFHWLWFAVTARDKVHVLSFLGGLLGGWAFDTKWFYRVTARGKSGQHTWVWEKNKIFWRLFIPWISAIVAFVCYSAVATDLIPLISLKDTSPRGAFAASFVFGYFSDIFIGVIADKVGLKKSG
jgi:hypothetical protein